MNFLKALGLGVVAGVVVYIVGVILASVGAIGWVVGLGNALKDVSGLIALVVFVYVLVTGWPNGPRRVV